MWDNVKSLSNLKAMSSVLILKYVDLRVNPEESRPGRKDFFAYTYNEVESRKKQFVQILRSLHGYVIETEVIQKFTQNCSN